MTLESKVVVVLDLAPIRVNNFAPGFIDDASGKLGEIQHGEKGALADPSGNGVDLVCHPKK